MLRITVNCLDGTDYYPHNSWKRCSINDVEDGGERLPSRLCVGGKKAVLWIEQKIGMFDDGQE